jgi:hypothetical protein
MAQVVPADGGRPARLNKSLKWRLTIGSDWEPKVHWSAGAPTVTRTPAYKHRCSHTKRLLLQIRCFGATA